MGYADSSFSFNPEKNFTFDPSQVVADGSQNNPFGNDANPYVPACGDNTILSKQNYRNKVSSYIKNFGQRINYWSTGYNFAEHDYLYGESPTSRFRGPRQLKAVIDFSSYTTFLTKFGMMSDSQIKIYLSIDDFAAIWGPNVVPLDGDVFFITDSACDRPLKQSQMVFEVTDKSDMINPVDFLGGHYFWVLDGKRYDFSYELNTPVERFMDSASDEGSGTCDGTGYGLIESNGKPQNTNPGEYPENVDEESQKDMDNRKDSKVYGSFIEALKCDIDSYGDYL